MAKSELALAIEQVCDEKNIAYESVIESIESALAVAYRKETGRRMLNVRAEFNPEDGTALFYDVKTVVEDPSQEEIEAHEEEERRKQEEREKRARGEKVERPEPKTEEEQEEEAKRFNPKTDLGLTDAKVQNPDAEVGDEIITELPLPDDFGRVAAMTAKQVIIQKLREAERDTLFNEYKDRVGEIVNATVHRVEGRLVYMDLGAATAIMPPSHQVRDENYTVGSRYKVYLTSVEQGRRGPEVVASRTAAEMVRALFEMEVPEISSGSIEVKSVAREAGSRSKIAVHSMQDNIDPIGSCVGQRGARVQTVMNELGGEKIDIIEFDADAVKFIVNALSPAKVISVMLDEENKEAKAFVADDQLSLAIGKGGQNVRLAAKLTGWKIDVIKDGEESSDGAQAADAEDESEEMGEEVEAVETPETVEEAPATETEEVVEVTEEAPVEEAVEEATEETAEEAGEESTEVEDSEEADTEEKEA